MTSDSSELSEPPSDLEKLKEKPKPVLKLVNGKLGGFKRKPSTPQSSPEPDQADLGREPSPPHEHVLADNPDIALLVMFRSRFDSAFAKTVPNLGPQDIEYGVVSSTPNEGVENLLCGLIGLVLNRKKNPERGHFGRALEECISSQKSQWPRSWSGRNPMPGNKTFQDMTPTEKLGLLRTLVHWSLTTSEAINAIIKESYKQARKDDDINQPLSVQPWGLDTRKRKFYLVEGQVDAPFRIYRESQRKASTYSWISVAGTIEEAQKVARDLRAERGQSAHRLAARITNAVPMFEEREEKRRKREYRRAQKERFTRPEPGFSLYEGRTRGKRMRYTYEEDDIYASDENRRSSRNSRTATPAEGPTFTASGRQVRSAFGKTYGDHALQDGGYSTRGSSKLADAEDSESSEGPIRGSSRLTRGTQNGRSALRNGTNAAGHESADSIEEESDADATGDNWGGDDQDFEGKFDEEEEEADDMSIVSSQDSVGDEPRSLLVKLKYGKRLKGASETPQDDIPNKKLERVLEQHPAESQPANHVDTSAASRMEGVEPTGKNAPGTGLSSPRKSMPFHSRSDSASIQFPTAPADISPHALDEPHNEDSKDRFVKLVPIPEVDRKADYPPTTSSPTRSIITNGLPPMSGP